MKVKRKQNQFVPLSIEVFDDTNLRGDSYVFDISEESLDRFANQLPDLGPNETKVLCLLLIQALQYFVSEAAQ